MYFTGCFKVEHLKREYKRLAMLHHPDRGGDLRVMQAVNAEYHEKLKGYDGSESTGEDGKAHKYSYRYEREQSLVDKISELIALRMVGVNIDLIGTWIWVTGETKPQKDKLKAIGMKWHSKRLCWFYQNDGYRHRYSNSSLNSLAAKYGCESFKADPLKGLN